MIKGINEAISLMKEIKAYEKEMYGKIESVCPRFTDVSDSSLQLYDLTDEEIQSSGMTLDYDGDTYTHYSVVIDGIKVVYVREKEGNG